MRWVSSAAQFDTGRPHDHHGQVLARVRRKNHPAAKQIVERRRLANVINEVTVLQDARRPEVVDLAAKREDQRIVVDRRRGQHLTRRRQRGGLELDRLCLAIQPAEIAGPIFVASQFRMGDEADVLVRIV